MKSSPRPKSEASQTTNEPRTRKSASMLLLATALDTTIRFFVPTIGGTLLGIWLDSIFHTAPVLLIVTVLVGFGLSIVLVTLQIKQVRSQQ